MKNKIHKLKEYLIFTILVALFIYTIYLFFFNRILGLYFVGGIYYLFVFSILLWSVYNNICKFVIIQRLNKYTKTKNPTVAIIFGVDNLTTSLLLTIYKINKLFEQINYFNEKDIKFRIYMNISKKEFNKIIENDSIQKLYLIGHGRKTAFKLNKKEIVLSYDYQTSKHKKDEVHLHHCTHEDGKSLIDFIVKEENKHKCHISNGAVYSFFDRIEIGK